MATTKDETPQSTVAEQQIVVGKTITAGEVKALYNKGLNLYAIAEQVYGFTSEDAVEKVRQIVGCE